LSPNELKHDIIERFISRWRKQVGNDVYPVFRLIVPEKDRERAMYGLKEKAIAFLLIKILGINRNSEDANGLLNWKQPGQHRSASAGDFAGRCYEVVSKRPFRTTVGSLTIAQVNRMLDKLSVLSKQEDQVPIFEEFYRQMNPTEMMWLIRIILRAMKIGATERTLFSLWHPDAENLFNVSSSLRRVCWELSDPLIRLEGDKCDISLMQCFQPQLCAFSQYTMEQIVRKMGLTEEDKEFWIEEKLDGERMQFHMIEDDSMPGGKRFNFWSRKGKDYTYLYGNGFEDPNGSLTRHLKEAFHSNVRNIILDGEMITWDMDQDAEVPFGQLKTAALSEQKNMFSGGRRPLFRIFDCLYLNDMPLTNYTIRDRRKALEASLVPVSRRIEINPYQIATTTEEIETALHRMVAEHSEGLVVKNPRSAYRLNLRPDDWIKVKPEYMDEFGERLDCCVVGGYYGSGHRGGGLSSFLCGLRLEPPILKPGETPQKCWSFFKVGGGIVASDYATIRHHTDGKWNKWDPKRPPTDWVELGGGNKQFERPDEWIKPEDSLVFEVKAASVHTTDQFRTGFTLRFPRFVKVRTDKTWKEALTLSEFIELRHNAERERKDKEFKVDDERKTRRSTKRSKKKPLTIVGAEDSVRGPYAGPETKVFEGLTFFIITETKTPFKKSKAELEKMVKANGGTIVQSHDKHENVICVAESKRVRVASIIKEGKLSIIKPAWLFDCVEQCALDFGLKRLLLPMEPA
jgi:DNA ligase-4